MPRLSLSLHLPDELNPLLDSLTPLLHIQSGIFDLRSIDEQEVAPQTQVAIGNISSIVDPRGWVAMGLRLPDSESEKSDSISETSFST